MSNAFANPRYLRGRPFLVVTQYHQPSAAARTERRGWINTPGNVNIVEHAEVVDNIGRNRLREATVIVDIMRGETIKNRLYVEDDPSTHDAPIQDLYLIRYESYIKEGVSRWLDRQILDATKDGKLVNETESEEAVSA